MKTDAAVHNERASFGRALALTIGTAVVLVALAAAPKSRPETAPEQVAVVFAPWLSADEAFARVIAAGARPVRLGQRGTIIVATLENEHTPAELRAQGAWAILDPIVAGSCVTETRVTEDTKT
jgi:hypothetical protein